MTISKTTITFTVLHRTDEPIEDLQEALARSYNGHAVGMETGMETEELADQEVQQELTALHNDGEFFDDDLYGFDVPRRPTTEEEFADLPILRLEELDQDINAAESCENEDS